MIFSKKSTDSTIRNYEFWARWKLSLYPYRSVFFNETKSKEIRFFLSKVPIEGLECIEGRLGHILANFHLLNWCVRANWCARHVFFGIISWNILSEGQKNDTKSLKMILFLVLWVSALWKQVNYVTLSTFDQIIVKLSNCWRSFRNETCCFSYFRFKHLPSSLWWSPDYFKPSIGPWTKNPLSLSLKKSLLYLSEIGVRNDSTPLERSKHTPTR